MLEESEADRASQEEECSLPLIGREEVREAVAASLDENVEEGVAGSSSSASVVGEEEEELRSTSSAEEVAREDSSSLVGIEDRILIAAQTLLSILTPITSTTITTTTQAPTAASTTAAINTDTDIYPSISGSAEYDPANPPYSPSGEYDPESPPYSGTEDRDPAAASPTFLFEDMDDATLDSYANELLEENNLVDFSLSDDTLNTTTTTTTTAAPEVKTEVEEPDWNDVHQQGEELHMRPYQRRFEDRASRNSYAPTRSRY